MKDEKLDDEHAAVKAFEKLIAEQKTILQTLTYVAGIADRFVPIEVGQVRSGENLQIQPGGTMKVMLSGSAC
jgi:hypothetical protein